MMVDKFFTIKDLEYTGELVEKKSKFIATLAKVESEEEALKKISEVKKKNRDAKHNVFAYRLADGLERFSDDGEPGRNCGSSDIRYIKRRKTK